MSDKPSLNKVVKRAIAHRLVPKSFNSLISQLEAREPISNSEYSTHLLTLNTHGTSILNKKENDEYRINLVIHLSLSSQEQLAKFWKCLSSVDPLSQVEYLKKLAYLLAHRSVTVDGEIISSLIGSQFKEYTISIFSGLNNNSSKHDQVLAHHTIIFWEVELHSLVPLFVQENRTILEQREIEQNHTGRPDSLEKSSQSPPATTSFKTLAPSHLSAGHHAGYIEMKQFLWFTKIMNSFQFEDNDALFSNFVSNFCTRADSSGTPISKNPYLTAIEFIQAVFIGFSHSIQYRDASFVLFNWKNFIVSRVPVILLSLKFTNEESAEKAIEVSFQSLSERIVNSISSISIGSSKLYDLRQSFIKSCIFNKLLAPSTFQKFFPVDFKAIQQSLQHDLNQFNAELDLQKAFNEKLLNVNIEFTSLEESGLVDFIASLPNLVEYSSKKQLELGKIVKTIVEDLINYQDQEKLNRILLAILSNVQFVNIIAFNSNPINILTKLIDYADKDCFKLEDDDDERFQDIYSYFGVLLLGITFLIEKFKIDYSKINIKNSFTIGYLNEFYYRLGDHLTNSAVTNSDEPNSEDGIVISNFNSLMGDWINALFDESNDGLSDDLIKSVNIKHIYKLIPLIYQQSIIATRSKIIDMPILSNGIDYLSQVFLVPCTLNIINWLLKKILIQKTVVDNLFLEVLHIIIKSNLDTDKQNSQEIPMIIFRIVLNICGSNIIQTLKRMKDWRTSKATNQIIRAITKQVDANYIAKHVEMKHDTNFNEGLKKYFCSFVKPQPPAEKTEQEIAELSYIHRYLNYQSNHDILVDFLIEEIASYQKSNDDEGRLAINLGSYVSVLSSVGSTEDKRYWRKLQHLNVGAAASPAFEEEQFTLSIAQHYGSIFNSDQPDDLGFDIQIKEDEDMLDDDLFNDNALGLFNTRKATRQLRAMDVDQGVAKSLKILSECIQDELHEYYV
ncbi:mediator complex, subunit Med5 [Suhomyces tanzawaensis NRRL Y-17324]|uniref:Mediator of RNA polymerase II transcription subunit 5 n=1 Tax=Suhomyces tanzawaensis NRRL Y-17324 TaxID=984487 RepID=A0A1E4SKK6_9ASCO|nr:mediator complex, subunit Med5 [Suhomyces tanzawaensis NRRL Y-17324]ODV80045.1 mediator complex, subunit Med5 [Suhomyces tanzawaensis NRRL Y-17324]